MHRALTVPSARVLLTGGSGTLGRNLLDLLASRGDGTRALAVLRQESRELPERPGVEVARVARLDRETLAGVVADWRPTAIVHSAATGMEFPRAEWFDLIRFNVDFTIDLCELAARQGCELVFVSTGLGYRPQGRPLREDDPLDTLHPYGASKAAADLLVRAAAAEFGVPLTVLRPFAFTGLGDDRTRLFPSLLRAAEAGQPVALSAGTQVRDHCSARDVAEGMLRALETGHREPHRARVYNLGSGQAVPLRPLVERVVAELGLKVELRFGQREPHRFEPTHLVADVSRAAAELGWRPRQNLSHAVWQLARESFPGLTLEEPREAV